MDINYILYLIKEMKKEDVNFSLYGSDMHKYELKECLNDNDILKFEKLNNVKLPNEYITYLTKISNGGCGPLYGLEALKIEKMDNINNLCRIKDNISDEEFFEIIQKYKNQEIEFEDIYDGVLYIGPRKKTGAIGLVLTGENAGRILYYDFDINIKPFYTKDKNFEEWFTRYIYDAAGGRDVSSFEQNLKSSDNFVMNDKKLHYHINKVLGGKGCLPIVKADMRKITKLDLSIKYNYESFEKLYDMSNVYDISSLVFAKKMTFLNLSDNYPDNIYKLGFCEKLKKLILRNCRIENNDFIKNLKNLEYLDISDNNIKNLKYIEMCKNLKTLIIAFNNINNLNVLDYKDNKINLIIDKKQLKVLKDFKNYISLNIRVVNNKEELKKLELSDKKKIFEDKFIEKQKKDAVLLNNEKIVNIDNLQITDEDIKKYKYLLFVKNNDNSKKELVFNKEVEKLKKENLNTDKDKNAALSKEALMLLRKNRYNEALELYKQMTDYKTNYNVYRNIVLCYRNMIKREESLRKRKGYAYFDEDLIKLYKEKEYEYAYKAYLLFPGNEASVLDLANIYMEMDDLIEFDAYANNAFRPELLKAKLIVERLVKNNHDNKGAESMLFKIINHPHWYSCNKNCIYTANKGKDAFSFIKKKIDHVKMIVENIGFNKPEN